MELSDINRLAEIYFEIFRSKEWRYDWLKMDNTVRYLTDLYNTPRSCPFAFIQDGALLGGCFGDISDYFSSVQYYIKEIFIEHSLQNKGAGSGFLADVEADLKKRGVQNITLYTTKKIPAYGFYHKNGYTDGTDSVFMLKLL
jgi:aminoglycoside 6'-N-acetyltransferase I